MKLKKKYLIIIPILLIPFSWLFAENINDKIMLYSVLELIKREYVKDVSDKELSESAIAGMMSGLDPHSRFLTEKEFAEMKVNTKGEFGGIGIELLVEPQGLRVISPIDDTPAYKANLQPGDLIFSINDELIANMTPSEAIDKMRGAKGTKVKIGIIRTGDAEPIEKTLTREVIKANPVKYHLYDDIGYIRIGSFSDKASDEVTKAIKDINKKQKNLKGYVLDLRNNPGGLLEQAVYVSDLFLDKGVIVSAKGRGEKELLVFEAEKGDITNNLPLVVMINNGTASAPEIVSGALQDNKRALILGTESFGKGSIQSVIPVPSYGAISLTTALYYTPSGKSIQAEGIIPDIKVEPAKIELLSKANDTKFQFSESRLRNHLSNAQVENGKDSSKKKDKDLIFNKEKAWSDLYEKDYQLARAIDVLKTIQVLQKW
ncbi:MAG: S41 family peptidase [Rickettsiales bacterium]|jgi:carboxyl-terminal processing protease|nr:S41 family peptidase [Rickettsiales bacterium]